MDEAIENVAASRTQLKAISLFAHLKKVYAHPCNLLLKISHSDKGLNIIAFLLKCMINLIVTLRKTMSIDVLVLILLNPFCTSPK